MLEFIRHWVINIVALVLFIVIIEMLLPNGKMKKYVGIVTGTVLIIAVITPVIELFGGGFDFAAAQTSTSNTISRMQIEKDSMMLEEEQLGQIIQVYCSDMIEQLEHHAEEVEGVKDAKADIIINEDHTSERFGEIKRAYLEITLEEGDSSPGGDGSTKGDGSPKGDGSIEGDGSPRIEKVEAVSIEKITNKRTEVENCPPAENCSPELRKRLEDRIGDVFGIESENIIITQVMG